MIGLMGCGSFEFVEHQWANLGDITRAKCQDKVAGLSR
jgi:hypothetical protein